MIVSKLLLADTFPDCQMKVRKFTLEAGTNANNVYEYSYSIWLPVTGYVQTVS